MKFSEKIALIIEQEGLDQDGLARQVGVSKSVVSKWLNDKQLPGYVMLGKIVASTCVDAEWLLDQGSKEAVCPSKDENENTRESEGGIRSS